MIEGIQLKGDYVYFGISDKQSSDKACIYSIPKKCVFNFKSGCVKIYNINTNNLKL